MSYEQDTAGLELTELTFLGTAQELLERYKCGFVSATMIIRSGGIDAVVNYHNGAFYSAKVETEEGIIGG
jgi:hypothetical protein